MRLPFHGMSLAHLLLELLFPRFALVYILSATVVPFGAPCNLKRSVPFYHSYNTSPG